MDYICPHNLSKFSPFTTQYPLPTFQELAEKYLDGTVMKCLFHVPSIQSLRSFFQTSFLQQDAWIQ